MSTSERFAFEPFSSLAGVLTGQPLRIFPEGTFYRGERKLSVTKDRLQQFAANVKGGLPRFDIPINIEHDDKTGRYGTVADLEYFENGPQGPGLYATKYSLTDEGRKLLEQEKFIGLSGEAIWTLFDGAKYQDPQDGSYHDNVLVGLALTNKPYFGKEVNLYSAEAETQLEALQEDAYRSFTDDERKKLAKSGAAMPGGRYPIENKGDLQNAIHAIGRGKGSHAAIKAHIKKRAAALGATSMLPDDWQAADPSADDPDEMAAMEKCPKCGTMNDPNAAKCKNCGASMDDDADDHSATAQGDKMAEEKKPEQFTVSAEEFKALQDKAALVETMATRLKTMERARRLDQLTAHAESFSAVPAKPEELAEKFAALEEHDPKLFEFFDGLLTTMDSQVMTGGLFNAVGSQRTETQADTFTALTDRLLAEKFGGKPDKYGDAMLEAGRQRPDLRAQYENQYSVRPSKTQAR